MEHSCKRVAFNANKDHVVSNLQSSAEPASQDPNLNQTEQSAQGHNV